MSTRKKHRDKKSRAARPAGISRLTLAALGAAAVLAGCASTAPRYYSLQFPPSDAEHTTSTVSPTYAISVLPVVVPEQVARPQIVVRDSPGAEVIPLNAALWAGPLEAQIRNAVADALVRRLNVLDIGQAGVEGSLPVWRIQLDVRRFDSIYGDSVRQDILWRMTPQGWPPGVRERVCSAQADIPVGTGMNALVEGHRSALSRVAELIAQTLPSTVKRKAVEVEVQAPEGMTFRGCAG